MDSYHSACNIRSPGITFGASIELLAKAVPKLHSVHVGHGILLMVDRNSLGDIKVGRFERLYDADGDFALPNHIVKSRPLTRKNDEYHRRTIYAEYHRRLSKS